MLKYLTILPVFLFCFTFDEYVVNDPISKIMQPSAKKKVYIEQVISLGAIVILSDESEWVVYPADRIFTSMWLSPAWITVQYSNEKEGVYNFIMRNNWTKKVVRVHFIKNNSSD